MNIYEGSVLTIQMHVYTNEALNNSQYHYATVFID